MKHKNLTRLLSLLLTLVLHVFGSSIINLMRQAVQAHRRGAETQHPRRKPSRQHRSRTPVS